MVYHDTCDDVLGYLVQFICICECGCCATTRDSLAIRTSKVVCGGYLYNSGLGIPSSCNDADGSLRMWGWS